MGSTHNTNTNATTNTTTVYYAMLYQFVSYCNMLRPVHLLRVFLLRVRESNFPGRLPIKFNGHENSHPLELRVKPFEIQTLRRRTGVAQKSFCS